MSFNRLDIIAKISSHSCPNERIGKGINSAPVFALTVNLLGRWLIVEIRRHNRIIG